MILSMNVVIWLQWIPIGYPAQLSVTSYRDYVAYDLGEYHWKNKEFDLLYSFVPFLLP